MTPHSIVVADDSDLYRAGIVRAVKARPELELAAEYASGDAALDGILALEPSIALLDVRMPGLDGLEVCRRLRMDHPHVSTRLVLLSAYVDDAVVSHAADLGADGYLSKAGSRRDICDALIRLAVRSP